MNPHFLHHNSHLDGGLTAFIDRDPQLRALGSLSFIHTPTLLARLPSQEPGIYTLGGGRQVGKTTLLKQWMARLMADGVDPTAIAFFSGELIDDHHALIRLLVDEIQEISCPLHYLIVDEVSYIREWDRAVKYLADAGLLQNTILVLTGSDLSFIQEARMRFPGRRGGAEQADFHLSPLSFRETLVLKKSVSDLAAVLEPDGLVSVLAMQELFDEFNRYLIHGGYLTAINDLAKHNLIRPATLTTYHEWIRGDVLKRGKREQYLREILGAIVKRYGSQISWNSLAQDLSIDHPKTVADYVELLATMDAVFIQPALLEDKLTAAPKKPKKVMFVDPFIFHAVRLWLAPCRDPFQEQITPFIGNQESCGRLVEACVATHFHRYFPTFYIKAEGEIDVAAVSENRFWPIEIKWTGQVRHKDLKQLKKYKNAVIWGRVRQQQTIDGVPIYPLPLALARLDERTALESSG